MVESILAQVPLFTSLPPAELERLAGMLRVVTAEPGQVLFREGEFGQHFYVVLAGEMEVVKALGTESERVVGIRRQGEFLGELSLLNPDGHRTASVRARTPAELLQMTRADFDLLLHRNPHLAYEMVRVIGGRLTASHEAALRDLRAEHVLLLQAHEDLKAAQAQIIEKEKLERELQLAYQIQMSILPRRLPRLPGYDLSARMLPARAVGGDLFDFVELDDGRLGLVIGDVADKGVPAAIFMAQARALLRAEAARGASPAEVLRRANHHLLDMNEAGLFVTALYGLLEPASGRLIYARAGHEPPLLAAGGEMVAVPHGMGQPLGIFENVLIDEQALTLPPGGSLLLYTDGATDAEDAHGVHFGLQRLGQALLEYTRLPARPLCEVLLGAILEHQGDAPQHDDVTLVVVRRLP